MNSEGLGDSAPHAEDEKAKNPENAGFNYQAMAVGASEQ